MYSIIFQITRDCRSIYVTIKEYWWYRNIQLEGKKSVLDSLSL